MYQAFYGLHKDPFSLSPDPEFLFMSATHRSAIARIKFAIQRRQGLAVIYGPIGTGKTLLSRVLFKEFREDPSCFTSILINPSFNTQNQLLQAIMQSFSIDQLPRSKFSLLNVFNAFLTTEAVENSRNVIIIIDEAQSINAANLELIRQLLNFEGNKQKYLQIVFFSQPELRLKMNRKPNLKDRIAVVGSLDALDLEDTQQLIAHRLRVAGCERQIFSAEAVEEIYKYSQGYPRRINVTCENALIYGFSAQEEVISPDSIRQVVRDFEGGAL
ncbi:MAG: AAA family ATPase [Candidatus Latescibacteria bacterium]|nr:AAA family ATPase [Candidatus Latescibacterota bacterium]